MLVLLNLALRPSFPQLLHVNSLLAQKNQKKIGQAESNPETSGPAENLREEAAEMTDEGQDSKEPA
ncbi:MAG: hypothetical protein WB443_02765 [Nitrososphaeraceae archaeon]